MNSITPKINARNALKKFVHEASGASASTGWPDDGILLFVCSTALPIVQALHVMKTPKALETVMKFVGSI